MCWVNRTQYVNQKEILQNMQKEPPVRRLFLCVDMLRKRCEGGEITEPAPWNFDLEQGCENWKFHWDQAGCYISKFYLERNEN